MRNTTITQSVAASSVLPIASGTGNVPPLNKSFLSSWDDPEDYSPEDVLAPFDYEGFLRREGLA